MLEELVSERITESRIFPKNIFDASIRAQRGEYINIEKIIPKGIDWCTDYANETLQQSFDWVASTVNSEEYIEFGESVKDLLGGVKGNQFVFDIEGVVMSPIHFGSDFFANSALEGRSRIYHTLPWIHPVIQILINNDNEVVFWTGVIKEVFSKEIKKAMDPNFLKLKTVTRDDWKDVIEGYRSHFLGRKNRKGVIKSMRKVFSVADEETFNMGLELLNSLKLQCESLSELNFKLQLFHSQDLVNTISSHHKYPQLIISPDEGFFIDENPNYINTAIEGGWSRDRALLLNYEEGGKEGALEIVKAIHSKCYSQ